MTTPPAAKPGSPVYCAGPMFSTADLRAQRKIAAVLEDAGFITYVPQRDGIEVAKVMDKITTGLNLPPDEIANIMDFARKIVFALDIFQVVERCRSLVFNMDGRVPDEGSVVETAVALATDRPVVIFKTTPITILGGYDNPMVQGLASNWTYVNERKLLPGAVSGAVAGRPPVALQPSYGQHLDAVISLGRKVWTQIDLIHAAVNLTPQQLWDQVIQLEQQWASDLVAAFGS